MRANLERRLTALESGQPPISWCFDALTDSELERLESLLIDREAGRWSSVYDLQGPDRGLIAKVQKECGHAGA